MRTYQITHNGAMSNLKSYGTMLYLDSEKVTLDVGHGMRETIKREDIVEIHELKKISPSVTLMRRVHV